MSPLDRILVAKKDIANTGESFWCQAINPFVSRNRLAGFRIRSQRGPISKGKLPSN